MWIVKRLFLVISLGCSATALYAAEDVSFARARASAKVAGYSLGKVQRWLHEKCLPAIDKETGLAGWQSPKQWNYRDTAADCYPFVIWAAFYTDREVLDGAMRGILEAEQKLCNHIDGLPVDYDLVGNRKFERTLDQIIFGASEYAKDGLVPIVELTGRNQWYDRLKGITEDIFNNANVDTLYGRIPSDNIEVNGELLQVLPRLYAMSGEKAYLDRAHRLADYYLKRGEFVPQKLYDHGCEIIGGLGLLLAVDSTACPERFKAYEPHIRYMCDEIIRRGTNSDGIIVGHLQSSRGPHDNVALHDGWGYDYVGFLDYDMATGRNRYRRQVEKALSNLLKGRYKNFNWDHGSRDNIADSVEGGLYLLNRLPVTEGFRWADREVAQTLVDASDPARLWETDKLEANTVRTVLIHAMMHTQNIIARPWRSGMQLGASPVEGGIAIVVKADKPYSGRLEFDIRRHRAYMGFEKDWPRMNTMPEWFAVDLGNKYVLKRLPSDSETVYTGKQLHDGVPLELQAGIEQCLLLNILQN